MFRIKICGVRLKNDLLAVEKSGGDAVGLNFFPPSVRSLDPGDPATRELADLAGQLGLLRVGVFVNESVDRMLTVADAVGLDALQLHGDESTQIARALLARGRRVIRAVKLPRTAIEADALEDRVRPWRDLGCHPLLDADAGSAQGGSGKTLHWPSLRDWAESREVGEWTLAGGLRPENIAAAIAGTGAASVDTASGVECPRGSKNPARVADFIAASGLGRSTP